jgi:hypothetical protein
MMISRTHTVSPDVLSLPQRDEDADGDEALVPEAPVSMPVIRIQTRGIRHIRTNQPTERDGHDRQQA